MNPAPLSGVLEMVEEEKIHRLSMAYMLLSDAIWRRSEEALERACLILRKWYIDYQITPIDLAHTLTLIHSTMVPQGRVDGTSFTYVEAKELLSGAMAKIMRGVPLIGRRARFLFEASEPLSWVSQRPSSWHTMLLYKETIMSNLLEAGIAASGITVDLVSEILNRSWDPKTLVDVAFASIKGHIGQYVFVKELKSVQQAIRENPGAFVTALFGYLQPIYDHVVVKGRVDRYPSTWHDLYDVSLQLLTPITELLASGGLHGSAKEMGAKLWLLMPYLWMQTRENIYRNVGEKGFILSLEGVAEKLSFKNENLETALPKPLIESVRHLYRGQLRHQLRELCAYSNIARARITENNLAVRSLVGLLAGVTILFPEETGDFIAELAEDFASGQGFSYVKPRTARKRLLNLLEHLIDQIPVLYSVIVAAWPGRRQALDKIIDTIASRILVKVV